MGTVSTNGYHTIFTTGGLGTCTVSAEYNGMTNSTGVLTVASVDEIIIRDDWNGGGEEVLDESFSLGNQTSDHGYFTAAYNDTYGYLVDVEVTWTSSNPDVTDIMGYSTSNT